MAFSINPRVDSSSCMVSQLPANVPSADVSNSFCSKISNFCSKMGECILKVVAAVRNFFVWIFSCCSKQKQNPTLTVLTASETSTAPAAPTAPAASDIFAVPTASETSTDPTASEILAVSTASAEELLDGSKSTEDLGEIPDALDLDSDEAGVDNEAQDVSDPEIEKPADIEPEKSKSLFNKGVKFISRNGNQILSKATGIKTEYATSAMDYLALSAAAVGQGKYKFAAIAGMSSVSAAVLAGINLVIPKEVRELNRLTTPVNPT
jgi:hypothetical protein